MLADLPVDASGPTLLPALIGAGVVLLLVAVAVFGYWGLFDPPKWVRAVGRLLYRPRRRHRWYRRNQLRPVRPVARVELEADPVQLLPVGEPLAIESSPRPYRYASRAQHKEPLAEELTW